MRFSRLYERTEEFRSRCKAFDFAVVGQTVVDVALSVRKSLSGFASSFLKGFRMPRPTPKKPHQLVLELNGLAQLPMFR